MKNDNSILLIGVSLLTTCLELSAKPFEVFQPYLGAEIIQTNQDYKTGFGNKVFRKNPQNYNLFTGLNFHKNIGVELGYEFQPKKTKHPTLVEGDYLPGAITPIDAGQFEDLESSIKTSNPNIGIFFQKTVHTIEFKAMFGLAASRIKARHAKLADDLGPVDAAEYQRNIYIYSKSMVIPIIKISATYLFNDLIGLRLSANYRNTSKLKIKAKPITGQPSNTFQINLKDSFGIGAGISYYIS